MFFGQWVLGPPGAGKTTYCKAMQHFLQVINRPHHIINLDAAVDGELPYTCSWDIRQYCPTTQDIMQNLLLGPNGALMYSIEYLQNNPEHLLNFLNTYNDGYLIFDCPGQIELYTHHQGMRNIFETLKKNLDCRLTAIHLLDSSLCADPNQYISALLTALSGQILMEMPHLNVFTKLDLLRSCISKLDFRIDFYAEIQDLTVLLPIIKRHHPLNEQFGTYLSLICELITDFNLISFKMLDIHEKESMLNLLYEIDVANGFSLLSMYSDLSAFQLSFTATKSIEDVYGTIHEKYLDNVEVSDECVANEDDC